MPAPADQRPAQFDTIIQTLFSTIPFEGDELENLTVVKFAAQMMQSEPQKVMPFIDNIARTCVKVLADAKTADLLDAPDK